MRETMHVSAKRQQEGMSNIALPANGACSRADCPFLHEKDPNKVESKSNGSSRGKPQVPQVRLSKESRPASKQGSKKKGSSRGGGGGRGRGGAKFDKPLRKVSPMLQMWFLSSSCSRM